MLKEFERVVLTQDIPEYRLKAGDIGVIVHIHGEGAGYELEIFTVDGKTYEVITVNADQVRPIGKMEISHARPLEK